jgi:non-specific serine/threonine protein kinase
MDAAGARPDASDPSRDLIFARNAGLFGRSAELVALQRFLADPDGCLVTLTGPPGIGKTRLGVAAAADWATGTQQKMIFVELAELRDPAAVVIALAGALGVNRPDPQHAVDQVAEVLADEQALVVLDNFEHLLPAAPQLGQLLAACSGLRVLVTSRERLRLAAEREFAVQPLAIPSPADAGNLSALAANPCVSLLLDRAQRVRPQLALTAENAAALVAACVRLDGIPLALELAAAHLKALSPGELVSRLGGRMWLLQSRDRDRPTRHRALSTAIAWSYDLLGPAERMLFERLSLFLGTWTIEDVAGVCRLTLEEALPLVESLLDKSLIDRIEAQDSARFRMLESLREYAAERLSDNGSAAAVTGYVAYYADVAQRLEMTFGLPGERESWIGVGHHQANLRGALEHALAEGPDGAALWLAAALGWYCYTRGAFADGRQLLERAISASNVDLEREEHTAALLISGVVAWGGDELDRAGPLLTKAVERCTHNKDVRRGTIGSAFLGHVARAAGRYAEAARWHQRAELGFRELNNPQGSAWVRYDIGLLARDRGDLGLAERWLRESLREFRDLDYPWAVASAGWGLGVVLCARGEVDEAAGQLGEALTLYHDLTDPRGVAQCLEALSLVACKRAAYTVAAQLLGYAAAQRRRLAAPLAEADRLRTTTVEQTLISNLGPAGAERARQEGRLMPAAHAYELGLSVVKRPVLAEPAQPPSTVLTRRETQVAVLVAAGRTNRQIGTALGIAEKTAEVHVQHVMAKVDARNRAEVAAWVVRQGVRDPSA